MLPLILKRAMILAAVCLAAAGMIAFCAGVLQKQNSGEAKLRVGYTAEDNQITGLAVSYVQNMESIQSICTLEAVTEQEGKRLLENGELSALIVLPEDVINEILSGSNTPAVLYLPENSRISGGGVRAAGSMLFEELASAGMGVLGTAQAEIYASGAVLRELEKQYGALSDGGLLQSLYDDINRFNLAAATGREKLFLTKTLSLTENDTYAVYYGSALFTIYILFAGLFLGVFCKRSGMQQTMAAKRVGVGYAAQLAFRCLAGGMLMAVVLLLPFLVFTIPQVRRVLSVAGSWEGAISLLLIMLYMTVYHMMIYQIVEKRESALVVIGVLAVLQAYLSGCLIPSVLLPKAVVSIGRWLPASMIKQGFTILFTGGTQAFGSVAVGLLAWGVILFLAAVLSMHVGERDHSVSDGGRAAVRIRVPSTGMVLLRRLLHKKSMWLSLGLIIVLSAAIVETEKSSETLIKAAVYDESGDYVELLEACDGLVRFERYESEEAVQEAVYKGRVECGYILPGTLAADMTARNANGEILVYQDADAVAAPVVNEILFERIFRQVSLGWYEDYISQNSAIRESGMGEERLRQIAEDCFEEELLSGTTFHFEIRRLDTENTDASNLNSGGADDEIRTTYPVYAVAVIAVILCALQGAVQVAADIREQNFYKRNRLTMSALTLILPVLLGLVCAVLVIAAGR